MPFKFIHQEIPDLILIEPRVFGDDRGFFMETYRQSDFHNAGIQEEFCQDNHSFSSKNVLRGIHYQLNPSAQGKLVRVVSGTVWDVAVDLRKRSSTFKKWVGVELSSDNKKMFYIPPGFGHGFVTLSDDVHFVYKCTSEYDPNTDRGIIWNDDELDITWPVKNPLLSPKDLGNLPLKDAEVFEEMI